MSKLSELGLYTFLSLMIVFMIMSKSISQISVSNQLQYQLGNIPDQSPSDRTTLFNQLNFNYYYQNMLIGGRLEYFHVSNRDQVYAALQQKYIHFQYSNLEIKLGNFYESLGQGLVLRSYEIPGIIYEEVGTRQQYGFYKDIEGALIKYYTSWLNLKILYGYPLDLLQPPARNREFRRPNLVQGGEIDFILFDDFSPGIIYLRTNRENIKNEFAGLNFTGNLVLGIQYYFEYIQSTRDQNDYFKLGSAGRHAFYGSISQTFKRISFSFEVKDYHDFTLNFNDPPSLVREHARTLLNRGTHAIQPFDERGYQLEGIFNFSNSNTITANHAYAENKIGSNLDIFREYYINLNYYFTEKTLTKFFIDWSEDELVNSNDRYTGGILVDQQLSRHWSVNIDLQTQYFKRKYETGSPFNHSVKNYLADLAVSYSPDFSLSINIESAHDPLESNTFFEINRTGYKFWLGSIFNYRYDQNNTFSIFYGKRRGGNACSGGICYEVQPFEGFEFRLNSIL